MAWARKEEVRGARARELKEERTAWAARRGLSAAQAAASALASAEAESQAMEDWREDRYEEAGLATFMEGSAWAEFECVSNNLFARVPRLSPIIIRSPVPLGAAGLACLPADAPA